MIRYNPVDFLKQIAPKSKVEKLVKGDLTLNKTVLAFFDEITFISRKSLEITAMKVIKEYKATFQENKDEGLSVAQAKEEALNGKKLLINRVQNSMVKQIAVSIKEEYLGEFYIWLPSDAMEPDPEHQLNYGKRFQIGKGEMPGDRDGCKCGMDILVKEKELEL